MFNEDRFNEGLEIIKKAKDNIVELFNLENTNMERINNTEIFYGETSQELNLKYQELRQNYDGIEESLQNMIDFLQGVAISHRNLESSIINNINSQKNNLDVNS